MIGLFNECFPPIMDGVSVTVSNLASHFHKQGAGVSVVVPEIPGIDTAQYPYSILQYHSVPVPFRHPYRCGFPFLDYKFRRQFDSYHFDVFHAHCPFSSGIFAQNASRRLGIPLVATFHSKYRDDFKRVIPNGKIVDYLVGRIVRFYENADEVWVPQASVGEVLREYGYRGNLEVVDNGSEFAECTYDHHVQMDAKQELHLSQSEPLLLFVGQHIWEKNVSLIINSLALVKDMPYHALFVGDGYAKENMKALARGLGLFGSEDNNKNRLAFWDCVRSRELMRKLYVAADLLLFPSLYDNAPLVVREAASLHTPSLVAKGSSTAEIICDNENGFLADNEAPAFAARLRYLLEHPSLVDEVGASASRTLAKSWNDISAEVLDRYQHLICRYQGRIVVR